MVKRLQAAPKEIHSALSWQSHCGGEYTYIYCLIWSHAVHTISTINHDIKPLSSSYVCCVCYFLSLSFHLPASPFLSLSHSQTSFHILFARTILNWAILLNRFSKLYAFKMWVCFFGWRQKLWSTEYYYFIKRYRDLLGMLSKCSHAEICRYIHAYEHMRERDIWSKCGMRTPAKLGNK